MDLSLQSKDFQRNKVIEKKHFTLAFIVNEGNQEVLLGLKKRGFGKDFWNGFGGKVETGESIIDAAAREVKEECGMEVTFKEELGYIEYEFIKDPGQILVTHVFKTSNFSGNIIESEEMLPKWWPIYEIPYDTMWPDSKLWYNNLFEGKKFSAFFLFDNSNKIIQNLLKDLDADKLDKC